MLQIDIEKSEVTITKDVLKFISVIDDFINSRVWMVGLYLMDNDQLTNYINDEIDKYELVEIDWVQHKIYHDTILLIAYDDDDRPLFERTFSIEDILFSDKETLRKKNFELKNLSNKKKENDDVESRIALLKEQARVAQIAYQSALDNLKEYENE